METIKESSRLGTFLNWCVSQEVSDIHLQVGKEPWIRIHGKLQESHDSLLMCSTNMEFFSLFADQFSREILKHIENDHEFDTSFWCGEERYRANFSRQRGLMSFSFRHVPFQTVNLDDMQLPSSLLGLTEAPRGLVLLTGPTGQGKSTTARALLQDINEKRAHRIISIEDPIEYLFKDKLCLFEQREVGMDTDSFAHGIRNAMRQDPDILFVGEIRDLESVYSAIQACETGHLVITTLHADSTAQAISRIIEFYPLDQQANIRSLLARNLQAVVCQRLVPNKFQTRTPCVELMINDATTRKAIIDNDLETITDVLEVSNNSGMHSFDQYLMELYAAEIISKQTLLEYAFNEHSIDLKLRGIKTNQAILKPNHH